MLAPGGEWCLMTSDSGWQGKQCPRESQSINRTRKRGPAEKMPKTRGSLLVSDQEFQKALWEYFRT